MTKKRGALGTPCFLSLREAQRRSNLDFKAVNYEIASLQKTFLAMTIGVALAGNAALVFPGRGIDFDTIAGRAEQRHRDIHPGRNRRGL